MSKETQVDASTKPEAWLTDIGAWISASMLMLNQEKTELSIFKPEHHFNVNNKIQLQVAQKCSRSMFQETLQHIILIQPG